MEIVACELENLSPTQFGGVTKKAIRNRVMKLLELFAQTAEKVLERVTMVTLHFSLSTTDFLYEFSSLPDGSDSERSL